MDEHAVFKPEPPTPQGRRAPPEQAADSGTPKDVARYTAAILLFVAFFVAKDKLDSADSLAIGSRCSVLQPTYGVENPDAAYDDLLKAQRADDEIGLAELVQRETAVQLSEGTSCLVIDTNFVKHVSFYRQVRILSGPHSSKVFWVRLASLQKVNRRP